MNQTRDEDVTLPQAKASMALINEITAPQSDPPGSVSDDVLSFCFHELPPHTV